MRCLALEHVDPGRSVCGRLQAELPALGRSNVSDRIPNGHSVLIPDISESMLTESARDPEHLEPSSHGRLEVRDLRADADPRAYAGCDHVRHFRQRARIVGTDLAMAEEIARRAAVAVENARLFKEVEKARNASDVLRLEHGRHRILAQSTGTSRRRTMPICVKWGSPKNWKLEDVFAGPPLRLTNTARWMSKSCTNVVNSGRPATYEKEYVQPDGTRIPVLIAAAFISGHQTTEWHLSSTSRIERDWNVSSADWPTRLYKSPARRSVEEVLRIASEQARSLTGRRERLRHCRRHGRS